MGAAGVVERRRLVAAGGERWPDRPAIVEQAVVRSSRRRGVTIDLVLTGRARTAPSWCSPASRAAARRSSGSRRAPPARPVPASASRAAGLAGLTILVDTRERYPYRFAHEQATTQRQALPVGDYGIADATRSSRSWNERGWPTGPCIHADLAASSAFAASNEQRAAAVIEIGFGEAEGFLDAEPGAPEDHDQAAQPAAVGAVASGAHDGHDLLHLRRVRRVARALVSWRATGVEPRHGRRRPTSTGAIEQRLRNDPSSSS